VESGLGKREKAARGALAVAEVLVIAFEVLTKQRGRIMKNATLRMLRLSTAVLILTVALIFPGTVFAQEPTQEEPGVEEEDIEKYEEVRKAAKEQRIDETAQQDQTGTDPRVFSNKWMPFYRSTELENGLTQQDLTFFGTMRFSNRVGMFFELPVAQYRDFSDVPGLPPDADSDAIGMGDVDVKFLMRPKTLDFRYGTEGKMSGSVLLGTDFLLPTATDEALAGNAFVFAPIVAIVLDMPLHGFIAALNLYYFDVYKTESAPQTSRYVGKWFYMQPLTRPGEWWGGLFLLPEFQPIYDFETDDFSLWVGVEFGKLLAAGRIIYIKPGWGVENSEATDRKSTIEFGVRWFF
jgi:hypothetical protein